MTEDLTSAEKQALKWQAVDSWLQRNRSGQNYRDSQTLWFEFIRFYEGIRDV